MTKRIAAAPSRQRSGSSGNRTNFTSAASSNTTPVATRAAASSSSVSGFVDAPMASEICRNKRAVSAASVPSTYILTLRCSRRYRASTSAGPAVSQGTPQSTSARRASSMKASSCFEYFLLVVRLPKALILLNRPIPSHSCLPTASAARLVAHAGSQGTARCLTSAGLPEPSAGLQELDTAAGGSSRQIS